MVLCNFPEPSQQKFVPDAGLESLPKRPRKTEPKGMVSSIVRASVCLRCRIATSPSLRSAALVGRRTFPRHFSSSSLSREGTPDPLARFKDLISGKEESKDFNDAEKESDSLASASASNPWVAALGKSVEENSTATEPPAALSPGQTSDHPFYFSQDLHQSSGLRPSGSESMDTVESSAPTPRKNRPLMESVKSVKPLEAMTLDLLSSELLAPVEAVDPTPAEIEQHRPAKTMVSPERYEQLVSELMSTFGKKQLYNYAKIKNMRSCSSHTKNGLIKRIITELWSVTVGHEITDDIVTTREFASSARDLFFVLSKDAEVLRSWARKCNARIQVDVDSYKLTVSATTLDLKRFEGNLETFLTDTETDVFDLSAFKKGAATITDKDISRIAQLSRTFIERVGDNSLSITSLGTKRTQRDNARRLLLTALHLPSTLHTVLLQHASESTQKTEQSKRPTLGAYRVMEDDALPWWSRTLPWARLANLKEKLKLGVPESSLPQDLGLVLGDRVVADLAEEELQNTPSGQAISGKTELEVVLVDENTPAPEAKRSGPMKEVLKEVLTTTGPSTEKEGLKVYEHYDAVIGHVLHATEENTTLKHVNSVAEIAKTPVREYGKPARLFSHNIPFRSDLFTKCPPMDTTISSVINSHDEHLYSFCIRLMPSPWAHPDTYATLPSLEVFVQLDSQGNHVEPHIQAVYKQVMAEVLLPEAHADIAVRRKLYSVVDETQESVVEFLAYSKLNPWSGTRLHVPADLKVRVDPSSEEEISYVFTQMEYRREFDYNQNGLRLRSAVIDGGFSGGRRTETRLICGMPKVVGAEGVEEKAWEGFVEDLAGMVKMLRTPSGIFGKTTVLF
ncbi:Protein that coordinates expression of mitochondrially-encoded proteins [Saitoella coloradoensis]